MGTLLCCRLEVEFHYEWSIGVDGCSITTEKVQIGSTHVRAVLANVKINGRRLIDKDLLRISC